MMLICPIQMCWICGKAVTPENYQAHEHGRRSACALPGCQDRTRECLGETEPRANEAAREPQICETDLAVSRGRPSTGVLSFLSLIPHTRARFGLLC